MSSQLAVRFPGGVCNNSGWMIAISTYRTWWFIRTITRWWFQIFIPKFGEESHFDSHFDKHVFSKWVVQPPTRFHPKHAAIKWKIHLWICDGIQEPSQCYTLTWHQEPPIGFFQQSYPRSSLQETIRSPTKWEMDHYLQECIFDGIWRVHIPYIYIYIFKRVLEGGYFKTPRRVLKVKNPIPFWNAFLVLRKCFWTRMISWHSLIAWMSWHIKPWKSWSFGGWSWVMVAAVDACPLAFGLEGSFI